ncbi:MAG: helix-turn-helix domain-containing protein [Prevotella sp.]|nr:helix-turn-helix domain-containing protein [Prevotella sp.]
MQLRKVFLLVSCAMLLSSALAQTGHFIPSDNFSSSLISCFSQDRQGSIWVGTDYGLNRFDGYSFETFLHDEADSTSLCSNMVVSLLCDSNGQLWVGTSRGLDRFDPVNESFVHYHFPNGYSPHISYIMQRHDGTLVVGTGGYGSYTMTSDGQLQRLEMEGAGSYFSRFYEDSQGRLWAVDFNGGIFLNAGQQPEKLHTNMGVPRGFVELDGQLFIICVHDILVYRDGQLHHADIDMSAVEGKDIIFTEVAVGQGGEVYIGTRGQGVYRISPGRSRRVEQVGIDAFGIDVNTAKINAMMFDRDNNLWLGCHRKGLTMVPQRPVKFSNWSFEGQGIRLGSTISSVCEGDDGIIWCTVQGVGVYGFDARGHVVARPKAPESVEFIFRDKVKRYWIGTDDGLFSYDPLTGQYQQKMTVDCDKFNDMTSDNQGNIYISTFAAGFCVYNPSTGVIHQYRSADADSVRGQLRNDWVMGMSTDHQGLLWLATSWGVSCFEPASGSFLSQGWETQLPGVMCFDVCELHSGQLADGRQLSGCIAIATEQGLYLYDRKTKQVDRFPASEALANKAVSYIVQANDGDIWCSTSSGIWQYSLKTQAFIGHVNGNGLVQKEYSYGVGMHTDADIIYFGQNDGLTVFSPRNLTEDRPMLDSLQLTAFRVGDQSVKGNTVMNGVRVTDRAVSQSSYFTLSYLDHTITLAFSLFNYDNPRNVTFEYRVNGGDWIDNPEGKNEFTLGHLQPGTYRIGVRAMLGGDYTPEKVVVVTIRAPWYRSTLAYIIYFLLALALLFLMLRTMRRRANEQMNEEKMKFLINATHDIRSPLTIILSALKKLERNPAVDTIEHNSKRILDLVNQILDVRKIDKQQMHLHCQQTDMVQFVQGVCKMFDYNARERNVNFEFRHEGVDELEAWVDRTQFDKVITNLLSNAFKYSYDGGEVTVSLSKADDGQSFCLRVADNGVGMDPDSLKHIFDRFYQGSNSRRMHIDGTGIGLNLCKMIVDMHHGTIEAQNRLDTKGSIFTVSLPLGSSHLQPEEMDTTLPKVESAGGSNGEGGGQTSSSRRHVLIVDDDLEIGHFISSELGRYYKFSICPNGKDGLKELLTNEYDVVVSDVMMPEMDGFTMLRMIKTNLNLSHLPVIMLTSKADVGNRLEGLERGADAFLAKPFDMEELHLTIENLIQGRRHLKGKFSGAQQQADKLEQPEVKGNDEQLMERIMKVVNKYLSDSDFNVEMLCKEVGISRTQLHRKMKELTGLSTSEFIRNIRLEQAARLLKEQKINVTQVAYTVGFSNLAHFSTVFRKHFGVAPSEYAEKA